MEMNTGLKTLVVKTLVVKTLVVKTLVVIGNEHGSDARFVLGMRR